jgi:hypothetical protein
MKQQRTVINKKDLPIQFGGSFWLMVYLLIDHFTSNNIIWAIYGILLFLWTALFGYVKSIEKPFSVVSFKNNVEQWLKND